MRSRGVLIFGDKNVRRVLVDGEWFFSVVDVVGILSESVDVGQYIKKMRQRDVELKGNWGTICTPLESVGKDGRRRVINCSNMKGIFRIIQSVPSKRAEPFKLWLAKVGSDRIDEIDNPELAQDRARLYYERKGYSKSWIEKRLRGIVIRQDLTSEWKDRGVEDGMEFAILTDEIAKATFGVSVIEHKKIKGLNAGEKNANLRDSMTDLELIFGMLGEKVATEITRERDSEGMSECRDCAREGGEVAGNARLDAERRIGKSVVVGESALGDDGAVGLSGGVAEGKNKMIVEVADEE